MTASKGRAAPFAAAAVAAGAVAVLAAAPAAAYVGPGAGLSMLGALWAVLAAIGFALAGIVIWPVRAALRRRKAAPCRAAAARDRDGGPGAGDA